MVISYLDQNVSSVCAFEDKEIVIIHLISIFLKDPCASGTDNCSLYASCIPSQSSLDYKCVCESNHYGDGVTCKPGYQFLLKFGSLDFALVSLFKQLSIGLFICNPSYLLAT